MGDNFWTSVISALAGGLNVGSSVFSTLSQSDIANKNLEAQRETNAQNLALQQQAWSREDSAVQRRAADLKAAGINPLLAAGSAASSMPAVHLSAPQRSEQATGVPQGLGDALMSSVRGFYQIAQTQAQTDLIRQQTANAGTQGALLETASRVASATAEADIAKAKSLSASAGYQASLDKFNSYLETKFSGTGGLYAQALGASGMSGGDVTDPAFATLMAARKILALNQELTDAEKNGIALKVSGLQAKILEEFSKFAPGDAQGVKAWLDALNGVTDVVGSAKSVIKPK